MAKPPNLKVEIPGIGSVTYRPDRGPLGCTDCAARFIADGLLVAEFRHLAVTEGEAAARLDLAERLADEHAEHEGSDW